MKKFKCEQCSRTFNRKDKLLRHEKIHLMPPTVYNCSDCPAVFIREHLLQFHSKMHEKPSIDQTGGSMPSFQPIPADINGFAGSAQPTHQATTDNGDGLLNNDFHYHPTPFAQLSPAPMNLSVNRNEPMNLSNDRMDHFPSFMKQEPFAKNAANSDDEADGLQIVEDAGDAKAPANPLPAILHDSTDFLKLEMKQKFEESMRSDEIPFSMSTRITELEKLEPLKDLPMEILNND